MIAKPTEIPLFGCIDKFTFAQRHEVKVLDTLIIILDHTFSECAFGNGLANVFEDEIMRPQIDIGAQTVTFLFSLDDRDIGVLASKKSLVLACRPTTTVIRTFHLTCSVDTVGIVAAGEILLC